MWKLPFHVLGVEAYSDIVFTNSDECVKKFGDMIRDAVHQVEQKLMKVEKLLIFKHQVIALPPSYYDQRLLAIADAPNYKFDTNRPKSITFKD